MTVLQRLLKYPHAAVFDKDPVGELAFTLRHAGIARWSIADRVFIAAVGDDEFAYDMGEFTVGELADALRDDGFDVLAPDASLLPLSSLVLVEGSGSQGESNGDRVLAFTSLLWVLLSAYAGEVTEAGRQVREALRQMIIWQAEGEWLDLWGALYGESRIQGELDAAYAPRIPREAFRIRCNARGIELAIRDATGYDVRIEEPWTQIFTLDQSLLSGPDKFYDGDYIGYHLIKPTARVNIDWPAVRAVIDRNRAAGVLVLGPELTFGAVTEFGDPVVHFGGAQHLSAIAPYEDRFFLDRSELDGDYSIPNHDLLHRQERRHRSSSVMPGLSWGGFAWEPDLSWTDRYVVLAEFSRDYRSHGSATEYRFAWAPMVSWESYEGAWSDNSPAILMGHTRVT
jgi:hypothetical protein